MEILNSWKEIAVYLGRGVRTVQRWERDLGLPVHRPKGKDRSAVLAFPEELDTWLHRTPVRSLGVPDMTGASAKCELPLADAAGRQHVRAHVQQTCRRSRELMTSVLQAARRHQELTLELCQFLQRFKQNQNARAAAASGGAAHRASAA